MRKITLSDTPNIESVDLTFVRPERRELVKRRLTAILAFLALESSTSRDAERFSKEAGVATPTFYNLVRVWKRRKDPEDLQGGRKHKSKKARLNGDEEFLDAHLKVLPHDVSIEKTVEELERRADEQGVTIRSRSVLRTLVANYRRRHDLQINRFPSDLAIDFAALDIPIEVDGKAIMPVAAVLFDTNHAEPLCAVLTLEMPSPSLVAKLLLKSLDIGQIRQGPGNAKPLRKLHLNVGSKPIWKNLQSALVAAGIEQVGDRGRIRLSVGIINFNHKQEFLGIDAYENYAFHPKNDRQSKSAAMHGEATTISEAQAIIDSRLYNKPRTPFLLDNDADIEYFRYLLLNIQN